MRVRAGDVGSQSLNNKEHIKKCRGALAFESAKPLCGPRSNEIFSRPPRSPEGSVIRGGHEAHRSREVRPALFVSARPPFRQLTLAGLAFASLYRVVNHLLCRGERFRSEILTFFIAPACARESGYFFFDDSRCAIKILDKGSALYKVRPISTENTNWITTPGRYVIWQGVCAFQWRNG